jgi:predicted GNAT family N-acyltransferase
VGSALLLAVVADIPEEHHYLYLHAQLTAMGLYSKYGFIAEGPMFEEAGIKHFKMVLKR